MSFDPSIPLELLNGTGMVLEAFFLSLMLLYLVKESRRRKLSLRSWIFRLPPPMNFALAVLVFDGGVLVRTSVVWSWRRFYGAGGLSGWQLAALVIGAAMIVLGALWKIRAISRPDWGDGPWLLALAAMIAFLIGALYFR